jgi:hypothetical protein
MMIPPIPAATSITALKKLLADIEAGDDKVNLARPALM